MSRWRTSATCFRTAGQLLDDASFKIPDGVTAAIVGPNGAGKTTLLRMLAGDMQPSRGHGQRSAAASA